MIMIGFGSLVLLRLIIAHFLTDFVIQPASWGKDIAENKFRSSKLYLKAFMAAIIAYIFSGLWFNWRLPVCIFIGHIIIGYWKSYYPNKLKYAFTEQVMYILIILIAWIAVFNQWTDTAILITAALNNRTLLVVLLSYIVTTWPVGSLIGIATEKWRIEAEVNREGLAKAGLWIGLLERFLILTFILIEQYTAVGFLIAAKSILRFSDKDNTQKKTEYVLIGTLMSFAISIIIGLIAKLLISWLT